MTLIITDIITKQAYYASNPDNDTLFETLPIPMTSSSECKKVCDIISLSSQNRVVIHLSYIGDTSPYFRPYSTWYKIISHAIRLKGKSNIVVIAPPYLAYMSFYKKRLIGRLKSKLKHHCNRKKITYYDNPQTLEKPASLFTQADLAVQDLEGELTALPANPAWGFRKTFHNI